MIHDTQEDDVHAALQRVILPLVAVASDGKWHPIGTAFVIGSPNSRTALLLTAAHNVEHVRGLERRGQQQHPTIAPDFRSPPEGWVDLTRTSLFVLVPKHRPEPVEVIRCWWNGAVDVALLLAIASADTPAPFGERLAIDSRPVPIGADLVAVGYPGMTAQFTREPDYENQVFAGQIGVQLHTRRGVVTAVHPEGIGIHRAAGFSISVPFDSGMSGGPLLDLAATPVCARGVIGSDFSVDARDGALGSGLQAFASELWPAMGIPTQLAVRDEHGAMLVSNGATLLDFIKSRVVDDQGRADRHVRVEEEEGKQVISWSA